MAAETDLNPTPLPTKRDVQLWPLIRYHYFLIFFMSGIGTGLGYLHYLNTAPMYESKCQIFVRNDSKSTTIPFAANENNNANTRETPHAFVINTPLVIEKALDKPIEGSTVTAQKRVRDLPIFADMASPAFYITSKMTARPILQGGLENNEIVNITMKSPDPFTAKVVLDAVVDSYKDFLGESHKNVSKEVLELIESASKSILEHLNAVEKEYADFRQNAPLLYQEAKQGAQAVNLHKLRMHDIELQRAKLLILATQRRAELQSVEHALENGGSREALAIMFKSMKQEGRNIDDGKGSPGYALVELIIEHQLLLEDLGQDHPKVKAFQRRIDLHRNYFGQEVTEEERGKRSNRDDFVKICMDAIRFEINSIESQAAELDEMFEDERDNSKSISGFEERNEYYQGELERTESLYQRVLKRLDELNLLQDYGGYKTSVISPPRLGLRVSPVFNQSLLLGAAFGAAFGFGLAYLLEANDRTFHSPEEISDQLGLPVVGHVAFIDADNSTRVTGSRLDAMLITVFRPKSSISESYRGIRSSLYFSTRGGQHKVIQVTSPNPGDGKTTLCANLAVSIAQSGKRILIIDADFRRPRVHDLFGLDKSIGMSSVIAGEADLPDAIQETGVENLWGLACGPRPNNPSELVTSRRFEELLNILREQYDLVLIDTPPLLAVTDAECVAARVDGVILTIRLSKRTRREAMRATTMLANVSANTLGVVINGSVNQVGHGYGRYSGYYGVYQYRYGSQYTYDLDENNISIKKEIKADEPRRHRRQRS